MSARKLINTFDIDGVIWLGEKYMGLRPEPDDIIITGRSIEERQETFAMLRSRGIHNEVHFNNIPFDQKTREGSGRHKGETLQWLKMYYGEKFEFGIHFEDDPIQVAEILKICPDHKVILLQHNLVEKENVRRPFNQA